MKERLLALVGNPNAGKTTLFNALTGGREHVGNRPGVTVSVSSRRLSGGGAVMADLPGVYSLEPCSAEEALAREYLTSARPDAIVNIVDATNLERNLYLTTQLLELGIPVVLALNMMDEARKLGIRFDTERLSAMLGVAVVPISARSGEGLEPLRRIMLSARERPRPIGASSPEARYRRIAAIVAQCVRRKPRGTTRSDRIDALLTSAFPGIPIFLGVMALVFVLTFDTLGQWLSGGVEALLTWLIGAADAGLKAAGVSPWLHSLICDGLLTGVGGVLAFLPQIALLFFFLSLLEDSGYMARTAFMTDRLLRRFGISGRAFIPMLMGFGCTVPAALATRTLASPRERRLTIFMLPFMSCSAKLPVYALVTAAFFPAHRGLVLLSLYLLGICGALLTGLLFGSARKRDGASPFIIELPPYRLPRLKNTFMYAGGRIQHFVTKAGTIILLMSLALWLLMNFDWSLRMVAEPRDGMLCAIGGWIAPAFKLLGFGSWQAAVALLTGLIAKEAVVSSLSLFLGVPGGAALSAALGSLFTPVSAYAFLVFVLLYVPCFAALATMRRELGGYRYVIFSVLYQTLVAYLAAAAAYAVGSMLFAG